MIGPKPRNVLIISPTTDYAGVGINLKRAFDQFAPAWHARHVVRRESPYGYPMDFYWPRRNRAITLEVREMFRKADVVHVMDQPSVLHHFHREPHHRFVVQHLGTRYREDPDAVTAQSRLYGAVEITDSIDLLIKPHVRWVPVTVDVRGLYQDRLRLYHPLAEVTRIAHAPTDRATSSTDVVEVAIQRLEHDGFNIDFDLIEGVSNRECIERKAQADIYVDRIGVGFGVNAIEAWSMGIPVVSGFGDEKVTDRARREFGTDIPWVDATNETMYQQIRSLITDRAMWLDYSRRGLDHANRFHSPQRVVERTTEIYARAIGEVAA